MNGRRWAIVVVVLILALGVGAYLWFRSAYDKVEVEEDVGFGRRARANPFLAAELFLREMDIEVSTERYLKGIPEPNVTLFLLAPRKDPSPLRSRELLAFVAAGGHLIVTPAEEAHETEAAADPLLAELGAEAFVPADSRWKFEPYESGRDVPAEGSGDGSGRVRPPGAEKSLRVRFDNPRTVADNRGDARWSAVDGEYGSRFLQYRRGLGLVTILADASFMDNARLRRVDHARLLWRLVTQPEEPIDKTVWIVYEDGGQAVAKQLLDSWWRLGLAGVVLLLMWWWAKNLRVGPLLPEEQPIRRSIREHLQAVGRYLWGRSLRLGLLQPARENCRQQLQKRYPDLAQLDKDERAKTIAERTGMSEERVARALTTAKLDDQQFVRAVRDLQDLESSR